MVALLQSFLCAVVSVIALMFAGSLALEEYHSFVLANDGKIATGHVIKTTNGGYRTLAMLCYRFEVGGRHYNGRVPILAKSRSETTVKIRYLAEDPAVNDAFEVRNRRISVIAALWVIPFLFCAGIVLGIFAFVKFFVAIDKRIAKADANCHEY